MHLISYLNSCIVIRLTMAVLAFGTEESIIYVQHTRIFPWKELGDNAFGQLCHTEILRQFIQCKGIMHFTFNLGGLMYVLEFFSSVSSTFYFVYLSSFKLA